MTCIHPIKVTKYAPNEHGMLVPCGKCNPCRISKASEWSIRCEHEILNWDHNSFVRLSYDDEHMPPDGAVSPRELQLFFKRLRKRLGHPIKYLACGEYGETTERAHYHAIIFGYDKHWQFNGDDQLRSHPNFRWNGKCWDVIHGPLKDAWPFGHITIGTAGAKSARYIAGYTLKSNVKKIGKHATHWDGRHKPFFLVSKGIGKAYADKNHERLRKDLTIQRNGKAIGLPRQYHVWLETPKEDLIARAQQKQTELLQRLENKPLTDDNTFSYLQIDRYNKSRLTDKRRSLQ